MFKANPELMGEVMSIHKAIVRKSRWQNFGYVIEEVFIYHSHLCHYPDILVVVLTPAIRQ